MAITRIGSWTEIDSAVDPGSASVTVPSDATLMVVFVTGYFATVNGFTSGTNGMTIAGAAMDEIPADGDDNWFMGACFHKVNPTIGSQTLAWNWTGSPVDGVILVYGFYKGVDTSSLVRDSEGKQGNWNNTTDVVSKTLTASSGDLILGWRFTYTDTAHTFSWTNATKVADYQLSAGGYNDASGSLAEQSPSGNQTITCVNSQSTDGGLISVVLKPASGGGGTVLRFSTLLGAGQ